MRCRRQGFCKQNDKKEKIADSSKCRWKCIQDESNHHYLFTDSSFLNFLPRNKLLECQEQGDATWLLMQKVQGKHLKNCPYMNMSTSCEHVRQNTCINVMTTHFFWYVFVGMISTFSQRSTKISCRSVASGKETISAVNCMRN